MNDKNQALSFGRDSLSGKKSPMGSTPIPSSSSSVATIALGFYLFLCIAGGVVGMACSS